MHSCGNRQNCTIVFWPTSFQCSFLHPLESSENPFMGYKKGILGRNQWTGISKSKIKNFPYGFLLRN